MQTEIKRAETFTTKPLTSHEKYLVLGLMFEKRVFLDGGHGDDVWLTEDDVYDFFMLDPITLDENDRPEVELSTADAITLMDRMDVERVLINEEWYISVSWLVEYFDIYHV